MLKKPASFVLASFRPSTYRREYAFGSSLAAALLDGLFEHPADMVLLSYVLEPSTDDRWRSEVLSAEAGVFRAAVA